MIGRVGKLSIKIPWKKLGWDPIEIVLENVFLSAAQRDDQEVIFTLRYVCLKENVLGFDKQKFICICSEMKINHKT